MRILSANLRNDGARADLLLERIDAWDVDVLVLQELGPRQAQLLGTAFEHGKLEPALDYTGMGIAAKKPISVSRLPLPCRDGRVALIEASQFALRDSFALLNLHIAAPHTGIPWRTARLRRGQVSGTLRWVAQESRPLLVMGDLNATPSWPAYRQMCGPLRDVARSQRRWPARTWGPTPAWPRLLRIDHALARDVSVAMLRVVEIPGSDHSGVLVELSRGGSG